MIDNATLAGLRQTRSDDVSATYALPNDPHSPAVARALLAEALAGYSEEQVETAKLLVSELVTNVVVHTDSMLTLQILAAGCDIRVCVDDCASQRPEPRAPQPDSADGRGLCLVDAMAPSWGWNATVTGKQVWFEL